ncbi:MAG: right-handed parallel beta-helix repeat-containing protein, partial [Balneolaceae bacterium]
NWGTIRFMSTSDDATSSVSETEIRYAKHGMIFTNAAPSIDKVTVLSCRYMGFGIESGSTVHIANSTIQNCGYDPVAISTNSAPSFSNITFNSNGSNGVGLLESNNLVTYYYSGFNGYGYFYETTNTVSSDVTLNPYSFAGYTNLPFIMRHTWYIGQNTTLSVAPTVIFKGSQSLFVDGALKVLGTETEPVIFTSVSDDGAGGDSNNDGNISVPNPGQSIRIYFRASSIDSANHITHTEFRYPSTAIEFQSSKAKVENNLFQLSQYDAINIYDNSSPQILSNNFQNISGHSIYMDMFSNPTFSGNAESNVKHRGLGIRGGTWGSDATLAFRSFAGTDSITYVLHGNFTIPSGSKIIIPSGMTFKAFTNYGGYRYTSGQFNVEGALRVNGTENSPVVFTIDTDDSYGKPADIYTDGQVNDFNYRNGNWITYSSTSDDTSNIVNYTIFRNNYAGIVANSADPTVKNSRFEQLNYGMNLAGVSAPYVENNVFHNLNKTPLVISLVSYPQTTVGNTMSGTTWKAIGVREETLVQDVTLPKRDFAGKVGIPYYMSGNYTTGTGAVLTIDPGVIMKFENYRRLEVQKGLIAQGSNHPDSLIVFTTIYDDFYGGDTNGDGTATNSANSYWYGIKYTGTSLPEESLLDYTVIKNVRVNSNSYAGVLADNASPTITNSSIFDNGYGVVVWGSGNPVVTNNDIYNNSQFGVYNRDKTFTIDATNNWWGSDTGPTHSANPGGTGNTVTDGVNYNPFVGSGATNPVLGDVSLNGKVQSFDASVLLRHAAFLDTMNATQLAVADVSGNGSVTSMDASYVLQYVVGLIEAFPAELASKSRYDLLAALAIEDMKLALVDLQDMGENRYSVNLELDNVSNLYAFEIELSYPNKAIEMESITATELLSDASLTSNITNDGKIYLAMASGNALDKSGAVVNITFTLKNSDQNSAMYIDKFMANEIDYSRSAVANESIQINLPTEFELYQNYPNPFNPSTTIGFNLAENNIKVSLIVYNILGQKVKTVVNDVYQAGRHKAVWDGTNDAGMQVSTGVYIYRIQAGDIVQSKKLTFIK